MRQDIVETLLSVALKQCQNPEHVSALTDNEQNRSFMLLERALINRANSGPAAESRTALWMDSVIELLERIPVNDISAKQSPELNVAIRCLKAFRDAEYILDMEEGKMGLLNAHRLILSYAESSISLSQRTAMGHEEITERLNQAYLRKTSVAGRLRLSTKLHFEISNRVLRVKLCYPLANMQDNASAFESWILCLKRWIGEHFDYAVIDWEKPEEVDEHYVSAKSSSLHYNRLLFRVHTFITMFPEWCTTNLQRLDEVEQFVRWFHEGCLINQPLAESLNHFENEAVNECERKIESWFSMDPDGRKQLALKTNVDPEAIYHQLPIGIFRNAIDRKSAVMNRGTSAIDLWAIDHYREVLHIFELKKKGNHSVGILSELLFYTALINEASIKKDGCLKFGYYKSGLNVRGFDLIKDQKYNQLKAHLLIETLHPLIDDQTIELLNMGLGRIGPISTDIVYYDYEQKRIL